MIQTTDCCLGYVGVFVSERERDSGRKERRGLDEEEDCYAGKVYNPNQGGKAKQKRNKTAH